jgi:hypothetical protein
MERQWHCLGVVAEGQPLLYGGINLGSFPGASLGETVALPHPSYPKQLHSMSVSSVVANGKTIVYAGAELSAGVHGLYVAV